ncbi:MAG TPA: hypothetical protein ACHBZ1_12280, partial [Arsenophonus nasoniae]
AELNRVVRPKGMILLFSKEPLTSQLIQSPHPNLPFSYRLIWVKNHFGHPLSCRRMPVNFFEDIVVFYKQFDSNKRDPRRDYVARLLAFIGKPPKAIIAEHGRQFERSTLRVSGAALLLRDVNELSTVLYSAVG